MDACGISFSIDLRACALALAFGWIDSLVAWLWANWWWPAIALLVLALIIWRLAGWPGLVMAAAGAGFLLGRLGARPAAKEAVWPGKPKSKGKQVLEKVLPAAEASQGRAAVQP